MSTSTVVLSIALPIFRFPFICSSFSSVSIGKVDSFCFFKTGIYTRDMTDQRRYQYLSLFSHVYTVGWEGNEAIPYTNFVGSGCGKHIDVLVWIESEADGLQQHSSQV